MPSVRDILAKDIMTKNVVSVEAGEHISRVAQILAGKNIHHVAVFENGAYAGLFGYKQLLRLHTRDPESAKVKVAVKNAIIKPPKISPETNLIDIADYLYRLNYKVLPVFEANKLAGIVSERDVVRAIAGAGEIAKRKSGDFMTPSPETVSKEDELGRAITIMREHNLSRLPVVDKDGKVAGLLESVNLMKVLSAKGGSGRDSSISHSSGGGSVSASGGATRAPDDVATYSMPVRSVMQEAPVVSRIDESLSGKIAAMAARPEISTIIVIDEHSHPIGIVSPKDIIQHIAALKSREMQYIQISGLEGIDNIDEFQRTELHKAIDTTVKKIAKSENIHSFTVHVKAYHTSGNKPKYAMRAKIKTDKNFVAATNWGWDPIDVCVNLMKEVEKIISGSTNKKRDNVRRALRDSKEARNV